MKYLLGKPEDFHNFVKSIRKTDKIGVVTHVDVDGLVSGVFLNNILESKNLKVNFIEFLQYSAGALKPILEKGFDILFFTDWNADNYPEDLDSLRKKGRIFVIDHHPVNEELKNKSGVIKTESTYCTSHALFDLGREYFNVNEYKNLFFASLIFDYTISDKKVLKLLKNEFPEITQENAFDSPPGILGKNVNNSMIYFYPNLKKIYDLVSEKKFSKLEKYSKSIEDEITFWQEKFMKEAFFDRDKKLYFYYENPIHSITKDIVSPLSWKNPNDIFVFVSDIKENKGFLKVSARAQNRNLDLNKIMKEISIYLKDSSLGGHAKAAGGSFRKEDLGIFKKLLLERI